MKTYMLNLLGLCEVRWNIFCQIETVELRCSIITSIVHDVSSLRETSACSHRYAFAGFVFPTFPSVSSLFSVDANSVCDVVPRLFLEAVHSYVKLYGCQLRRPTTDLGQTVVPAGNEPVLQ